MAHCEFFIPERCASCPVVAEMLKEYEQDEAALAAEVREWGSVVMGPIVAVGQDGQPQHQDIVTVVRPDAPIDQEGATLLAREEITERWNEHEARLASTRELIHATPEGCPGPHVAETTSSSFHYVVTICQSNVANEMAAFVPPGEQADNGTSVMPARVVRTPLA